MVPWGKSSQALRKKWIHHSPRTQKKRKSYCSAEISPPSPALAWLNEACRHQRGVFPDFYYNSSTMSLGRFDFGDYRRETSKYESGSYL